MHVLLDGLKLDEQPLYLYAGQTALPLLAMVAAVRRASGKDMQAVRGVVGADPIGELAERGTLSAALSDRYDEMAECAKWAVANAPGLRTIMVRSDVYSRGGASDIQEASYTIDTAVTYLRELQKRGLSIDEAASQIMFGFSMGANFFLQIAKLRAMRPI